MAEKAGQRDYWDGNLDATNLGRKAKTEGLTLQEELMFCGVPDIQGMVEALPRKPGNRLLEIGAGLGANAALISGEGATVFALDLSHERLVWMRERLAELPAARRGAVIPVLAKAEALPFRDACLDGVCSRAVLIHTELDVACGEAARVLKPGGAAAFAEPMAHNPLVNIYRRTLAPKEWRGITRYFTADSIATVRRHFAQSTQERFYILSFLAFAFQYGLNSPMWFYRVLTPLLSMDKGLTRRRPRMERFAWFVLIIGRKGER